LAAWLLVLFLVLVLFGLYIIVGGLGEWFIVVLHYTLLPRDMFAAARFALARPLDSFNSFVVR
jgi:hypothetical protein